MEKDRKIEEKVREEGEKEREEEKRKKGGEEEYLYGIFLKECCEMINYSIKYLP